MSCDVRHRQKLFDAQCKAYVVYSLESTDNKDIYEKVQNLIQCSMHRFIKYNELAAPELTTKLPAAPFMITGHSRSHAAPTAKRVNNSSLSSSVLVRAGVPATR